MTGHVARRRSRLLTVAVVLAAVVTLVGGTGAQGQEEAVLGTAENFAVLAASTVTNTGETVVSGGDVGVSPGTSITGFPPGAVVGGVIRRNDAVAKQAQVDARAAYNALRSRSTECTDLTGQDLGTVSTEADPLEPGVYCFSSSAFLTGTLYLEAGGEYVFLVGTTLITATNSRVVIVGGPQDGCNIYWVVGSSATLGTDSDFLGTIIAQESITLDDRAEVNGRLVALTGAVSLIDNDITVPTCAAATTTTTAGGATTTTAGGATTTTAGGATTTTAGGATTTTAGGATTTTAGGGGPGQTTTTLLPGGGGPGQTTTTLLPGGGGPGQTTTTLLPGGGGAGQTTTTLLPGGGGAGPTTTRLAATTTTAATPATTTAARSATTTTVRPGTTGTAGPGDATGLGAGGPDSLGVAGAGEALALTGPTHLQPMMVAALLAVLLGAMMLMSSSGPGAGGILVAAGVQQGPRTAGGRDLQPGASTSQAVTPPPPPRTQAQVPSEWNPRRRHNSPAEATRSALRSAESISWTLRLPEA